MPKAKTPKKPAKKAAKALKKRVQSGSLSLAAKPKPAKPKATKPAKPKATKPAKPKLAPKKPKTPLTRAVKLKVKRNMNASSNTSTKAPRKVKIGTAKPRVKPVTTMQRNRLKRK